MRKRFIRLILFCVLFAGTAPTARAMDEVRFEMNTFMPSLHLNLTEQSNRDKDVFDVGDQLGIKDISTIETKIYLKDNLRVSYNDFRYRGAKQLLDAPWPSIDLRSELGLQYGAVTWFSPIKKTEHFEANWLVDLKGYRIDGQMGLLSGNRDLLSSEQMQFSGLAPTLGVAVAGDVTEALRLYGEVSALPLGNVGSFWDLHAGLKYRVEDRTFLHLGYRVFDLVTPNSALQMALHTRMGGPYFGLNYDF